MKLKRFREVPHTYQMALVKTELVKGLEDGLGVKNLPYSLKTLSLILGTHRKVGGENCA